MSNKGRMHKHIVQESIHYLLETIILGNLLHIIMCPVNHKHHTRIVRIILLQLTTINSTNGNYLRREGYPGKSTIFPRTLLDSWDSCSLSFETQRKEEMFSFIEVTVSGNLSSVAYHHIPITQFVRHRRNMFYLNHKDPEEEWCRLE